MSESLEAWKKQKKVSEIIFTPRDYQSESIRWILEKPEAGLFLAPGLGKTICFLSAFHILKQKGIVKNALVVAKRRIIHSVWPKEIQKWGLDFSIAMIHGSKKDEALRNPADINLINYEGLLWLAEQRPLALRTQFDVLCLDESSMVKNWNAKRSRFLRKILQYFDRRYILTGSPIPRSMMDIFSQIYMLDMGDALGKFIGAFRNRYWYPAGYRGKEWELQDGGETRIYSAVKPLILRFPKDVVRLPPLHKIERLVELPEEARRIYRSLEETFVAEMETGKIVAANAAVATQKLRQIAAGAVYKNEEEYDDTRSRMRRKAWNKIHDAKLDELANLIEELQGEPLLVAYEFDHERQRIQKLFPDIPHIGGGTSDVRADELIDLWNAGALPVLLGHPDSIAHGLNLQDSGWNICFFALGWNLENHQQFIDRVYRQGQKHAVWVYLLIAEDTIDEIVLEVLSEKDSNQERLFKALERSVKGPEEMLHEWKKVKLPGKLPAAEKVIKAYFDQRGDDVKWNPTWDVNKDDEGAAFQLALQIIVSIGGWLPNDHADFLKKVFGKNVPAPTGDNLAKLVMMTQKTIFGSLKLDTVDAERPVLSKGKLGAARIYVTKSPAHIAGVWPIQTEKEPVMANAKATKKSASKFAGKKAADAAAKELAAPTKSKAGPKKGKAAPKKGKAPAKKAAAKKTPAKKKGVKKVAAKKGAAKKGAAKKAPAKKGAAKKAPVKRNGTQRTALLKMLERRNGCTISQAMEKLGVNDATVRSMIGALRSANGVESIVRCGPKQFRTA